MPLSPWTSVHLAAALCALPLPARADAPRPVLHDATVVTDATLVRGAQATVFVSVAGATGLTESAPVAGAEVAVSLVPVDARPHGGATRTVTPVGPRIAAPTPTPLGQARAGADGSAVIRFRVPPLDPGPYRLIVRTRSRHGAGVVERAIEVADRLHLHLRTDRQVYRAGQTILWRVTAVGGADAHPAAGDEVELVARDPRDTAIWRGRQRVPASGMIAGRIPLGDDLLHGSYTLTARVRDAEASERVHVREFRLPVFEVQAERVGARPLDPGGSVEVKVTARYRYGEPVGGKVVLALDGEWPGDDPGDVRARAVDQRRAGSDGRRASGRMDASGAFLATLRVPDGAAGAALVHATVTDGAGRRERATLTVPLRREEDLRLALVPDRQAAVRGALHWFTAVTTDGHGHVVPARVTVRADRGRQLAFDSPGALRVALRAPEGSAWSVKASAVAAGDVAEHAVSVALGGGPLLQLREAVVEAGRPVIVTGRWEHPTGPVLATLLRDGAPIASTVARVHRGVLRAELRPPPGSFGLATVRLVEIGWSPDRGINREGEHLNVYLRPARLDVSLAATTRHRPGERTTVEVAVRDAAGRPVPGAALAASVVDERVLALGREGPELVTALQELDSIEDATSLGLTFAYLLDGRHDNGDEGAPIDPAAASAAMRAILAALPARQHSPELVVPAEQRWQKESERMQRARPLVVARLTGARGAIGRRDSTGAYVYDRELWQVLADVRWTAAERTTPWSEPTTWSYATRLDPTLAFDVVAAEVAEARLQRLADALAARGERARRRLAADGSAGLAALIASGDVSSGLDSDAWGSLVTVDRVGGPLHPLQPHEQIDLVSAGPDRTVGTGDDLRREDVFALGGGEAWGSIGHGSGSGSGYGRASGVPSVRIGAAGEAPTLRRRFDETVLWRVGVPTDARGRARLDVPLADAVTGWRVAVEALSATGAVGAARTRLETFLPLHLDAELPPRLAVGDRYRIPIAVANHSGGARRLSIRAALGGALRRADRAPLELELAAGESDVVHVEAEARAAGAGRIQLDLVADGRSVDRVERTLPVDPPGELVRSLGAGDVLDGRGRLTVDVPAGIAPGSLRGRLRLYRGAADLATEGLQGMLQEPYGCFEQTSSTTYPNLLVLRLLRGQPRMAAVRARASDLVGRGYQRLISYEVEGGGFSWFGESPANQVLTAYGLTEFVDMADVYPVDPALIQRTRAWLLGKQQRDGSWRPDAAFLHDWSQVQGQVATTAFIAWSLAEAGTRGAPLERALGFLRGRRAALARDPYLLALWAAAEGAARGARGPTGVPPDAPGSGSRQDVRRGNPALTALLAAGRQEPSGLVFRTGGRTIFHARGEAADVQLTALAVTALARAGRDREARRALDWLWQARSGNYGWGTTQGTVLALRAAALAMPPPPSETGALRVAVDGRAAGAIDLASVDIPSLALDRLGPGKHVISIEGDRDARGLLRADLRLSWREPSAPRASSAGLAVDLTTPPAVAVGEVAPFSAVVANRTRAAVAMPTVLLPVPPGLTVDPASLAALRRIAGVSKVEDLGDQLAVYLLDLAPGRSITLAYRLDAGARCDVLVRPASAYAFYTPEVRGRSSARRLRVTAPGARTSATSAGISPGPAAP